MQPGVSVHLMIDDHFWADLRRMDRRNEWLDIPPPELRLAFALLPRACLMGDKPGVGIRLDLPTGGVVTSLVDFELLEFAVKAMRGKLDSMAKDSTHGTPDPP